MKPNINDVKNIQAFKDALTGKNVSNDTIKTIEKALNKGMVFQKPEDLAILNVPSSDLNIIGGLVGFGPITVVVQNLKTVEFTFRPIGEEIFFYSYQFTVTYFNKNGFAIEQSYPIEDTRLVIVDIDLNDVLAGSKVSLRVKSSQGRNTAIDLAVPSNIPNSEVIEINALALANATINVKVDALQQLPNPPIKDSYQIKGKLISNRSAAKLDGYQLVIYASNANLQDGAPDFSPVAFAQTESNGYFVTSFLIFSNPDNFDNVNAGKVIITKDVFKAEFPIKLVNKTEGSGENVITKSMLPDKLIVVINEDVQTTTDCKDCGCSELNFLEKKVLEEYSYHTVVRTTEPSIIADVLEDEKEINLDDIYGVDITVPFTVFQKFHSIQSKQINPGNFDIKSILPAASAGTTIAMVSAAATLPIPAPIPKPAFNKNLLDKLIIDHKVKTIIKGNEKPVFKGRTHLNQLNQIDWDDKPTIYQAASIAHGHLLHFKQEWIADGYSIGDLVYSLPLAPGQKKQIAVIDWERRESAANSQAVDYEETLNNSLARDRDINEIVSGTLTENIRGNSKASTSGIGGGFGSSVMGIIPGVGSFGSLLGISGGTSSSGSSASQNSNRNTTANSLQTLNDRTSQAASVVRSQRFTVVQTVTQGERVQATSESVANYNHCHAITIQYFEVLRHFAVRTRLAGVQECLFVPLQMTTFDIDKCLRWRNTLEKHLFRRELKRGFDALTRIQNEKESPFENYYDSIGFPRKNYAEQSINFYSGELYMEFFFFNTKDQKIDTDIIAFYNFFRIPLSDYNDKILTNEELANLVGPRAIEYILDTFVIETDKGTDLKFDLSLLSTFRQNASLHVSIRQSSNTSVSITRDLINAINIKMDISKLSADEISNLEQFQNKYMKIKVRSGNLRYRTDNISGELFSGTINNDIFAEGDGVYLPAPLTKEELRNPRGEDVDAANNLIHHLNENVEYYNKCLFFDMTPERRFMLLDGIIAPGKANGRSVASVVENRIIGIAGNSLIMPVAPGNQLDPTIDETFDLFAQYYQDEQEPMRVSMPTKGIYAEAVMGKCNSCEEKDESRFWRWEESPIPDSPTTPILPLNTDTRRADPGDLQAKDFPAPIVNIQNAPASPDPTGLQSLLTLLGKGDSFRDLTGLNQNQLNALATFQKTMDTAQSFGSQAADLAKAAAANKLIADAQKNGSLSNDAAKDLTAKNLNAAIPQSKDEAMDTAKKQLDLIKNLEDQGGITAEDAQNARKNILDNLTKGDISGTSTGDLGSLMDKASETGTDVKKDGDSFEINGGFGLGKPQIVDVNASAILRSFEPGVSKSCVVKLSVDSKNAPSTATLTWNIPTSEAGKYTIASTTVGTLSEVDISGITPGLTHIEVVLADGGKTLTKKTYPLCIPQYITVTESGNSSPTLFENFLSRLSIVHRRDDVIKIMKTVSEDLLTTCNVRLIWNAGPFSESAPVHIPGNRITTVEINDQPTSSTLGNIGFTFAPAGPTEFTELILISPGEMTNPASIAVNTDLVAISIDVESNGLAVGMEPILVEILGRFLGMVLAHEIIHSLLGSLISASGHNIPKITGEIMNQGIDLTFPAATGFRNVAMSSPVQPSDFVDLTSSAIARLKSKNQGLINRFFPVPPSFR
ncbi:MAG: hypothetical protein ABI402_10665 [Ferruginibacter sp.]